MKDWRLPEHRREAFQRFYTFHLTHQAHPGMVYSWLPAIMDHFDDGDDSDQLAAWIVWLNGNTQNPVTTYRMLEVAPHPRHWKLAVDLWNDTFKSLQWDTDRRHQKSRFGEATERWATQRTWGGYDSWAEAAAAGWRGVWAYASAQPFMGRLSAWSMSEYARILFGPEVVPDIGSWMLQDKKGSQSHRNGLALVKGFDSVYWGPEVADVLGITDDLEAFAEELLAEAQERNPGHLDVGRYTMESALCTYKSWHKPNRRYPGVYADMAHDRLRWAEERVGPRFELLWQVRRDTLPENLRLEDNPHDPGVAPEKQNYYLETGEPIMMGDMYPDMVSGFERRLQALEGGDQA